MDTQHSNFQEHLSEISRRYLGSSISYLSAPCGAGKSHVVCDKIAEEWQYRSNVMVVLPTIRLIEEISGKLTGLGVEHSAITSKTHPNKVAAAVVSELKDARDLGQVLLVTWETYITLPFFDRRRNWKIVIDEIPTPDQFFSFTLPKNPQFILDHVDVCPSGIDGILKVLAKDTNKIRSELKNDRDTVIEQFRPIYLALKSQNHEVFVEEKVWDRFVKNESLGSGRQKGEIHFVSMLNWKALEGTLIMGANFEKSLLYRWLTRRYRVSLLPDEELLSQLRFHRHDFQGRARVYYVVDRKKFSRRFKEAEHSDGETFKEAMDAAAVACIGERQFLWSDNESDQSRLLKSCANGTRISTRAHGLNGYQDFSCIYISASLNRTPQHSRLLNKLGLSPDMLVQGTAIEAYYQMALRLSLRDSNATDLVDIIVPDLGSAKAMAELLGVTHTYRIASHISTKTSLSEADKKRRSRAKAAIDSYFQDCPPICIDNNGNGGQIGKCHSLKVCVTLHSHTKQTRDSEFKKAEMPLADFVKFLRLQAQMPVLEKDKGKLLNPGVYESKASIGSFKQSENFVQSSFLALDFDNGSVSKDDFIRLFGEKAPSQRRFSFMIMNTYSRSKDQPNRFRVILPYSQPATSVAQHNAAYKFIMSLLEENGFIVGTSGSDSRFVCPVQSFYLPCTVPGREDYAFFECYSMRERELAVHALNPARIPLDIVDQPILWDFTIEEDDDFPQDLIDRTVAGHVFESGKRHGQMWELTEKLAGLRHDGKRMTFNGLRSTLLMISSFDRELRKHAEGCIKSVTKYRWYK